jgi:hypothetical protein
MMPFIPRLLQVIRQYRVLNHALAIKTDIPSNIFLLTDLFLFCRASDRVLSRGNLVQRPRAFHLSSLLNCTCVMMIRLFSIPLVL